jgi:hypothetical protein
MEAEQTKDLARQLRRAEAEQDRVWRIWKCKHAAFVRSVNRMTQTPDRTSALYHQRTVAVTLANNELNVWKEAEFDANITYFQIRRRLVDVARRKTGH